jgi:hypothetical protein
VDWKCPGCGAWVTPEDEDEDLETFDNTEEMISFANEGMDIIDAWLRDRQYENN